MKRCCTGDCERALNTRVSWLDMEYVCVSRKVPLTATEEHGDDTTVSSCIVLRMVEDVLS